MTKKIDVDIQQEAIGLVRDEKTEWERATAFITENVAFQMRDLIRQLRRNYWGVFSEPTDPVTGRDKVWIPLTQSTVETAVKNIDLDTKDVNFRTKKGKSIGLVPIVRSFVRKFLNDIGFGEKIDDLERRLAIDGTAVWCTDEEIIKGKHNVEVRAVDLLNFYIDPTASSIEEADSVIERIVLTEGEFKRVAEKSGWFNIEKAAGKAIVSRTDSSSVSSQIASKTKYVELFRRRGWTPRYLFTGNKKDKDSVMAEILISGGGNDWVFHNIEQMKDENKGYEEAWYTRVPGRWYGMGIAEKILSLQLWLNIVINIRINRSYVSQLGLFKIKAGKGVTPKQFGKLAANGALVVQDMDDIEQMVIQEASQASYLDEDKIVNWSQRVTSAFETVTGESLPASTSATATAIQSRSGQSEFVLIKKGLGMFIQRWIDRQAMPIIMKNFKIGDIVRLMGEPEEIKEIYELVINHLAYKEIEKKNITDTERVLVEIENARQKVMKMGHDMFIKNLSKINPLDFEAQVYVTNEEIDKGVLANNLINVLKIVPEYRDGVVRQLFDLMGLDSNQLKPAGQVPQQVQGQGQLPQGTSQQLVTSANTGLAAGAGVSAV